MRPGKRSIFARFAAPIVALLWVCLATCRPAIGAEPVADEYDIKAAFIYHFTHFTEWPPKTFPDDGSPIVVALVGEDPFRGSLERAVRNKTVHGRRLVYRHFANANAVEACHLLFVSPSERLQLGAVLSDARRFGALTVADMDEFTNAGGMVRFVKEGKKVRFEIRRSSVDEAGLRISSQLLKLARIYDE
jgi:hypothetical protein